MEDDAMVRVALAETLHDLRYRVIEVTAADAALAVPVCGIVADLVLPDVMMPGTMDGVEFAAATGEWFPGLPVMLTTGHLDAHPELVSSKESNTADMGG